MLRRNSKLKLNLYNHLNKQKLKAKGRLLPEQSSINYDSSPEVFHKLIDQEKDMVQLSHLYRNKTVWQILCQILGVDERQVGAFEVLSPQLENYSCLFSYNANLEEMVRDRTFIKLNQAEEILTQLGLSTHREVLFQELQPEPKYMISRFILCNKE